MTTTSPTQEGEPREQGKKGPETPLEAPKTLEERELLAREKELAGEAGELSSLKGRKYRQSKGSS